MYDELKANVTFKFNDKVLQFKIDLEKDIWEIMRDIAENLTFFTFSSKTVAEVQDLLYSKHLKLEEKIRKSFQ